MFYPCLLYTSFGSRVRSHLYSRRGFPLLSGHSADNFYLSAVCRSKGNRCGRHSQLQLVPGYTHRCRNTDGVLRWREKLHKLHQRGYMCLQALHLSLIHIWRKVRHDDVCACPDPALSAALFNASERRRRGEQNVWLDQAHKREQKDR